mmetsp:Transcript_44367/g.147111  ORF Transcript_44367/g.147111 Transcript_44367/m.147111 type:complete len:314 (-) Transcript_44367:17-958(-)
MVPQSEGSASAAGKAGMQSVKAERPLGSAPMGVALSPRSCEAAVAPPTATSADGIFGWSFGAACMVPTTPSASARAAELVPPMPEATACTTSTVFRPAGTVRSSAFGSWPARIMTPMPVVKPAMTLSGTYLVMPPPRATPIASCSPPHARVMKGSVPRPCVCTASQTSRLIAAAGPVMASVVPPISPPATPATAALTSPTSGGTPLATAMANERGTATQPTVMPAVTSVTTVEGANILRHSGRRVGIPRSRIKPVSGLLPASCLAVADCVSASVATGLLTAELQRTMRNLATRHARWPREPARLSLIGIESCC